MLLMITTSAQCQSSSDDITIQKDLTPNDSLSYLFTSHITYFNIDENTLYVDENIYDLFYKIWNEPQYKKEKPTLISVSPMVLTSYYKKDKK